MKGLIELSGMEFHAFHGCLPEERRDGARYLVDFSCSCEIGPAAESDDLADTLDYSAVYDIISREMSVPSNLLEHVCGRIVASIRSAFPQITGMKLKLSKEHPPVGGPVEWSSVTVEI